MANICFFSGDITRAGGTEKVSIDIANALTAEGRHKIFFLSLCESNDAPFFNISPKIARDTLNDKWIDPGIGYLPLIFRLAKYIKKHSIDIIIDIDVVLDVLSIPARGLCKRTVPVKVISWGHFNLAYEWKTSYRRVIIKHFTKRSDHLITLTDIDADNFGNILRKMQAKKRISRIYNPMPDPSPVSFDDRSDIILTVGNLLPVKGIDMLMDIAKKVLPSHPGWIWKIVGDGPMMKDLVRFSNANGLTNQMMIPGRISNITSEYSHSGIYASTSRSEGLPMTLLEAKAASLPIISFDIESGPSEIIQNEVNGHLIKAFDIDEYATKLSSLMDDVSKRKSMTDNALKGSSKFKQDHIISEWNSLIDKLLK